MRELLEQIDKYLLIQEKKEAIYSSSNNSELKDIIEMVRNSSNKDEIISMFNEEIKEKLIKLKEGGII